MPVGPRHQARELALKMLFQVDVGRIPLATVLDEFEPDEEIGETPPAAIANAHSLVRGTARNLRQIDAAFSGLTEEWAFDRLANVDRNILRLAIYEAFLLNETPEEIVIDEAVELAKEYSTADSSRFINGILGTLSRQREAGTLSIGPETEPAAANPSPPSNDAEGSEAPKKRRRQPLRMGPEP